MPGLIQGRKAAPAGGEGEKRRMVAWKRMVAWMVAWMVAGCWKRGAWKPGGWKRGDGQVRRVEVVLHRTFNQPGGVFCCF